MPQPTEWTWSRLGELALPTTTWNPRSEPRDTIHYVDVSAISREELRIVGASQVAAASAPSRARKIVREGDTIFATVRPTLRRIAQIPASLDGEIVSTAFCVIRPDREKINPDFLFFALQLDSIMAEVAALETGASYPAVRDSDVLDQIIPVPPLPEQLSIAAALRTAREALLHEARCGKTAAALKQSAMQELFAHGLTSSSQKETEIGLVPADWGITSLDHCSVVQTGAAKGRKLGKSEIVEVPYLRVANVQDGHLDLSEIKQLAIRRAEIERYRLYSGDVVLTEGGDFDKLGRGFIWRGQIEPCIHQNHVFAVRTDRSRLLPEFFAYQAQSPYGKAYFLKVAHKTTNLACINSTKLKAFPVLLPSIREQTEIVGILDAIDRKIELNRSKCTVLKQLYKVLLHELMTGVIRVSDDLDLSALAPAPVAEAAQ